MTITIMDCNKMGMTGANKAPDIFVCFKKMTKRLMKLIELCVWNLLKTGANKASEISLCLYRMTNFSNIIVKNNTTVALYTP